MRGSLRTSIGQVPDVLARAEIPVRASISEKRPNVLICARVTYVYMNFSAA